jgi:DNA-binding response OmpR family regulator
LAASDVSVAYDGEQALKMANELEPDVVLLDIGLPKMNGYDVAREIRSQSWDSGTLLVAITGWGQAEDKSLSRQAGIDHHLVKPVDPDALFRLIDKRKTGC